MRQSFNRFVEGIHLSGSPLKRVPVTTIDDDVYIKFRKPDQVRWDISQLWARHTVSTEAKDWGIIRSHQSKPLP